MQGGGTVSPWLATGGSGPVTGINWLEHRAVSALVMLVPMN